MAPRIENDQARFLRPLPVRDPNRQVGDLAPFGGGKLPANAPPTGFAPVLLQTAGGTAARTLPGAVQNTPRALVIDQEARPTAAPRNLVDLLNEVRGRAAVGEIARQNAGLTVAPLAPVGTQAVTPVTGTAPVLPAPVTGGATPAVPALPASVRTAVLADDMRMLTAARFLEEEARRQAATRMDPAVITPPLRMVIDTAV